ANDEKTLKEIAWSYYMNIENKAKLKKAQAWSEKTIKINNNYENNLTLAYLLYKQEKYSEAEDAVEYAIIRAGDNKKLTQNAEILRTEIRKKIG
ncbi:MAG: hypothetical protein LRY27_02785, partial [Chitinophagales bacterium]|nr:hypothetical protein [Chitinophagales bacterium]